METPYHPFGFALALTMAVSANAAQPNQLRPLTKQGHLVLQPGKSWKRNPLKVAGFTHNKTAGTGKDDRHGGNGLEIGPEELPPSSEFVEKAGAPPFIVWRDPLLPHDPAGLPEMHQKIKPCKAAAYWTNVEWFDPTCGELIHDLDQKSHRQNTIAGYVCDNGCVRDPKEPNLLAPRSKIIPNHAGIRTTVMFSWSGKIQPRREKIQLASSVDLWPKLAAVRKSSAPEKLPGIDLTDRHDPWCKDPALVHFLSPTKVK